MKKNIRLYHFNTGIILQWIFCVSLISQCTLSNFAFSQSAPTQTRILIVLDGSRSMLTSWGTTTKNYAAKQIITQIADSVENLNDVQTALRIFGHQSPQIKEDCEDSKLEVGFNYRNAIKLKTKLNEIRPQGVTPIAYSLEKTISDFKNAKPGDFRNVLLIITDGTESCGKNPCAVVQEMKNMGIIMKSYVLGLNVDEKAISQFECLGEFINLDTPDEAKKITSETLNRIFNSTTVRVDLFDNKQIPSETDVVMTWYDSESNKAKYNLYHTIDPKGIPDTFSVDPTYNYNVTMHTIPPLQKNNISITPFSYNVITQDAAQGELSVKVRGESFKLKINCIIKKDKQVIDVINTSAAGKYLIGEYNLEILTLPVITINNVKVEQDKTTTIEIPSPGYCTFIKGADLFGGIYMNVNNEWIEIYEFTHESNKETLALQPGKYKIIYRYKGNKSMSLTKEKEIEILTGTTITLNL
ncbi:MAG: VWA domain-containing protein [Fimbriimonadaceae bacterium]|nr:VWA domain-containing protein [Chitinophagales bacterium]